VSETPGGLVVNGLHAGYGRVPVLRGVDLTVPDGQIVGILGHNGMGKTTLLKALMGLLPASAGTIGFAGLDLTRRPSHHRSRLGIGYVPQGRGIFPALSVRENLAMGLVARGAITMAEAVDQMLQEFPQLGPLMSRQGGALSGGEQQLLALARCLVSKPRLLLLDEPTEGIQPSIIDVIEDKLRHLAEARSLSILLVEQNVEFITTLSNRVLVMQKGTIVSELTPADATTTDLFGDLPSSAAGRHTD
jgi:amidase